MTTTHETGVIQLANVGVPGAAVYPAGGVSKYTFFRCSSVVRLHDSGTGDGHAIPVSTGSKLTFFRNVGRWRIMVLSGKNRP